MEQSKKVGPLAATAAQRLSSQYVGFDFRSFYIEPGLNKRALEQGFLRVRTCFRFPLSLSFHHCCIGAVAVAAVMPLLLKGKCFTWCVFVRASLHMRREEKPTRCHWRLYCTYNMLSMFRALLCPSSGAWDYVLLPPMVCSAWLMVVVGQV